MITTAASSSRILRPGRRGREGATGVLPPRRRRTPETKPAGMKTERSRFDDGTPPSPLLRPESTRSHRNDEMILRKTQRRVPKEICACDNAVSLSIKVRTDGRTSERADHFLSVDPIKRAAPSAPLCLHAPVNERLTAGNKFGVSDSPLSLLLFEIGPIMARSSRSS